MRRRRLGAELRRLRQARLMTLGQVAGALGVAQSTLSRIETGKSPTRGGYLSLMLDVYGVDEPARRQELMDLARDGRGRRWWSSADELLPAGLGDYLGLEAEASVVRAFTVQVPHALVQTCDYARAVLTASRPYLAPEQVDQLLAVHEQRVAMLSGAEPVELRIVLDESALLRAISPAPVLTRQLEHLLEVGGQPNITIQVLSLKAASPILARPFTTLSFAEPDDRDVLCAEGIAGQVLVSDRAGDVRRALARFRALTGAALTPAESVDLIRTNAR
jgi:transcriptional regulator with XRE-family HTH domain